MADRQIEVEILRDIWTGEPGAAVRLRKGTVMEVPLDDAVLSGIESGAIRRMTPEMKAARAGKAKP